jgi:DHA1 family tetracycline resistance protein-like MFS transporter
MKTARLINIFIVVFVDLLGFSLILPLLPYYAEKFGANPTIIGLLTGSYAAATLIGAPLMGRLSDRFGRRPVLLLSVAGTFFGFLFLGLAEPVGSFMAKLFAPASTDAFIIVVLFFSRILDGLTGGNITVAQAYIADITDESNRAKGLGLIGAAFGLGFIIGPAVGGLLSRWGYSFPAFVAAGLCFINLFSIFFFLPESLTDDRRQAIRQQAQPPFTLKALVIAINRPKVGPLLHVRFFFGLAFSMFQSIFSLYAANKLHLSSQATGFVLAYVGLLSVLVQGVGIGLIAKRFRENAVIITALWLMVFGLIGWAFTSNLPMLLVVLLPLAMGGGTLNTVLNSALSKAVSREEIGGTLGISASLESVTRVISPSAGGFLLGSVGAWAPGLVSAVLTLWAVWFAYRKVILAKNVKPQQGVNPVEVLEVE